MASARLPGQGLLIYFLANLIPFNSPIRLWCDTGSTATCCTTSFASKFGIAVVGIEARVGLTLFGEDNLNKICFFKMCFTKIPIFFSIRAFVLADSSLFDNCNVLVERDLIGDSKPLGLNIPFFGSPTLTLNTKLQL